LLGRRSIPLAVTLFRFVLGPAFAVAYTSPQISSRRVLLAFGLIGLAIFTDWLDGYAARRLRAVSTSGKLLDPFADALFCMVVFVVFARLDIMPHWIVIALICREAIVTFVLRPLALWRGAVIAARMIGKVKTSFQFGLMITILVAKMPYEGMPLPLVLLRTLARSLEPIGLYATLGLSLGSLVVYIFDVKTALCSDK